MKSRIATGRKRRRVARSTMVVGQGRIRVARKRKTERERERVLAIFGKVARI